jgi:hypothetical protein
MVTYIDHTFCIPTLGSFFLLNDIMSIAVDDNLNIYALVTLPPEPFTCPEGSVSLHQLCKNCTQFFSNWKFLAAFVAPELSEDCKGLLSPYDLYTVAHLLQLRENCHFCNATGKLTQNRETAL